MYVGMYVCMYVCMYVGRYVCIVRMYVCMYVCMYVRMYVRMYVCMYVCITCIGLCRVMGSPVPGHYVGGVFYPSQQFESRSSAVRITRPKTAVPIINPKVFTQHDEFITSGCSCFLTVVHKSIYLHLVIDINYGNKLTLCLIKIQEI